MCQPTYQGTAPQRAQQGMTLIELMIVLSIAALLLMMSAPSFNESIRRNRLQTQLGDMASAVAFARSEAVVRGEPVSICASADGASCSGGDWKEGWVVFVDNGASTSASSGSVAGDGSLDGSELALRVHGPAPARVEMNALNFPLAASVTFLASGRMSLDTGGTFVVCDDRGVDEARALVINVSGQPRLVIRDLSGGAPGTIDDNLGVVLTSCTGT